MKLSVLICTYNRYKLLWKVLQGLIGGAKEPPDQVVMVNGGDEWADPGGEDSLGQQSPKVEKGQCISMKELFRSLYKMIPLKRQIFLLFRSIYTPPRAIYQHLYFEGQFEAEMFGIHFSMVNHNTKLETQVFWGGAGGYEEKHSLKLWAKLSRDAHTILDVGANTGLYSLVAKALNPQASVYAFEPIARFARELEQNCRLNHFDIEVQQIAASNQDGKAVIYDLPLEQHRHASLIESEALRHYGGAKSNLVKVRIPTIRLATFIQREGIAKVDMMKVDVEGHEPEVLEGMGIHLDKMRPSILVEIHWEKQARGIESLLEGLDYLYFDIDEETGPRRVPHLSKSSTRNYLICSPTTASQLKLLD
jgi:FkbM family methyltransferase